MSDKLQCKCDHNMGCMGIPFQTHRSGEVAVLYALSTHALAFGEHYLYIPLAVAECNLLSWIPSFIAICLSRLVLFGFLRSQKPQKRLVLFGLIINIFS